MYYKEGNKNFMKCYIAMGCLMSMKVLFFDSHLDFFTHDLGAVSDEHDEIFHQGISSIEKWYQVFNNDIMLADRYAKSQCF